MVREDTNPSQGSAYSGNWYKRMSSKATPLFFLIGNNIRLQRWKSGAGKLVLTERTGVADFELVEYGIKPVRMHQLNDIAEALGCLVYDFFKGYDGDCRTAVNEYWYERARNEDDRVARGKAEAK